MQNDKEKEPEINIIPVETDEPDHSSEEDIKTESAESYIEQLQRLQADFINYKRRTEKEMNSLSIFVKGNLIQSLLPVIDDMDLLIQHHQHDHQCPVEAVQMIIQKLKKVLIDEGLETIDVTGQSFDPIIHEAIAVEEVKDPLKENIIVQECQKGYRFHDNLLRPSRVRVAKVKAGN